MRLKKNHKQPFINQTKLSSDFRFSCDNNWNMNYKSCDKMKIKKICDFQNLTFHSLKIKLAKKVICMSRWIYSVPFSSTLSLVITAGVALLADGVDDTGVWASSAAIAPKKILIFSQKANFLPSAWTHGNSNRWGSICPDSKWGRTCASGNGCSAAPRCT